MAALASSTRVRGTCRIAGPLALPCGLVLVVFAMLLIPSVVGSNPGAGDSTDRGRPAPAVIPTSTLRPQVEVHSAATGLWNNISAGIAGGPPPRADSAVAFDPATGVTLLFGGRNGAAVLGDSWLLTAGNWSPVVPPAGAATPGPRYGAALAYDGTDGYFLLFGGLTNATNLATGTWTFNPSTERWSALSVATTNGPPRQRAFPSMAFDPAIPAVVLFGGYNASIALGTTWWFENGVWVNASAGQPALLNREAASLAYDGADRSLVLFGGWTTNPGPHQTPGPLADTWNYVRGSNGSRMVWVPLNTSVHPAARYDAAMSFDAADQELLLLGGRHADGTPYSDEWSYAGGNWTQLATSAGDPGPRWGAASAPTLPPSAAITSHPSPVVLLFSGNDSTRAPNDTWLFGSLNLSVLRPVISPAPEVDLNVSIAVHVLVFGAGAGQATVSWSGIPAGCPESPTVDLACTPTQAGGGWMTVLVSTANESVRSAATLWSVNSALTVLGLSVSPEPAIVGERVTVRMSTFGGTGPFSYHYYGLPAGCGSVNASQFNCTPAVTGTFAVSGAITDADRAVATSHPSVLVVRTVPASTVPPWEYLVEALVVLAVVVLVARFVYRRWKRPPPTATPASNVSVPGASAPSKPSSSGPGAGAPRGPAGPPGARSRA